LLNKKKRQVQFMPGFGLKDGARRSIAENAPKLFFVSIAYILIVTVMSELKLRLPGTIAAYDLYIERLYAGEIPSPVFFYSNLRSSGLALAAVLLLFEPVISVGYMHYCMNIRRGKGGDYKDIFEGFLFFAKVVLIRVITAILIFLWSLLFIFPGIAAFYRYRQAYYILLDAPEKSALQCIRESGRLMDGNKLNLFLLDLSFAGWFILDFVVVVLFSYILPFTLPIISIWLTPYLGVTRAAFYDAVIETMVV